MAAALECPACGARTPVHALPAADTFRCDRCGQVLKVPPSRADRPVSGAGTGAAATGAAATGSRRPPAAPRSPASPASAGPPAPPRRRGTPPSSAGAAAVTAAAVSATVDQHGGAADPGRGGPGGGNGSDAPKPAASTPEGARSRTKVAWYWRLVAWIVAVPLGLLLTGWPAYKFNGLRKNDLLDVFVGTGTGRYTRIAAFTLVWALVTAVLVQLFVEGGRWLARRRRSRRTAAPAAPVAPTGSAGAAPVARRPGRPPASARR